MAEPLLPPDIQRLVDYITQGRGSSDGPKAELEARVAVLVASEVTRATHSITVNLIELTSRVGQLSNVINNAAAALTDTITRGAGALNETTEAGNKLNRHISRLTGVTVALTFVAVVLTGLQIYIALRGR